MPFNAYIAYFCFLDSFAFILINLKKSSLPILRCQSFYYLILNKNSFGYNMSDPPLIIAVKNNKFDLCNKIIKKTNKVDVLNAE